MANDKAGNKIKPPTASQYNETKYRIALDFCPPIYACAKCGWPVAKGYCCDTCGDSDPQSKN